MKHLNELTLKEFDTFNELINEKKPDVFSIMELFGVKEPENLPMDKYNIAWNEIRTMKLSTKGVHHVYLINGRRYDACLDILKLNAAQFIDLQNYIGNFKLHTVLSVFMIPQYRRGLTWHTHKYNDGYDPIDVQNELYHHFNIGQASELSTFFLKTSVGLLETMKGCSTRKLLKEQKQYIKKQREIKPKPV